MFHSTWDKRFSGYVIVPGWRPTVAGTRLRHNPNDDERHYAASIGNVSYLKKAGGFHPIPSQVVRGHWLEAQENEGMRLPQLIRSGVICIWHSGTGLSSGDRLGCALTPWMLVFWWKVKATNALLKYAAEFGLGWDIWGVCKIVHWHDLTECLINFWDGGPEWFLSSDTL